MAISIVMMAVMKRHAILCKWFLDAIANLDLSTGVKISLWPLTLISCTWCTVPFIIIFRCYRGFKTFGLVKSKDDLMKMINYCIFQVCKWLVSVCRWSLHSWELEMWWSSWLHGWWQFWRGWLSWGLWTSWNNLQSQRISVRLSENSVDWKICCISRFIWLQWTPSVVFGQLYSVLLNWLIDFPWVAICHWGNGFSKKEL